MGISAGVKKVGVENDTIRGADFSSCKIYNIDQACILELECKLIIVLYDTTIIYH